MGCSRTLAAGAGRAPRPVWASVLTTVPWGEVGKVLSGAFPAPVFCESVKYPWDPVQDRAGWWFRNPLQCGFWSWHSSLSLFI